MGYFRNRRGQAIVEFAIILPVFMLMLFGLANLSMFLHDILTINEMARDIARNESVGITFDEIRENYRNAVFLTNLYQFNPDNGVQVTTAPENAQNPVAGQNVTVTVTATLNIAAGSIWREFLPAAITARLVMRREG